MLAQTVSEKEPRRAEPLDLVAFLVTAVASFVLRWDLAELVWGLWLSSLLVGYSLIVYGIFAAVARPTPTLQSVEAGVKPDLVGVLGATAPGDLGVLLKLGGALFMLAFFTFHFGFFHYVHAIFLSGFFPVTAAKPFEAVVPNAVAAFKTSWPLVLTTAVSMRGAFEDARQQFKPQTPYVSVVRMHLLIFVFAGALAAGLDNRWIYLVVLFFYFFPFSVLRRLWHPTTSS